MRGLDIEFWRAQLRAPEVVPVVEELGVLIFTPSQITQRDRVRAPADSAEDLPDSPCG